MDPITQSTDSSSDTTAMMRPQRPEPPMPGYDPMNYPATWHAYQEAMQAYSIALAEYTATLLETALKREQRRVAFMGNIDGS